MNKKLLVSLLLCIFIFFSCSGEKKDWKYAESENSITAYEDYLKKYPQGKFADEARSWIKTIYFEKAEAANTIEAYDDFLKRYVEGDFADKARSKIEAIYFDQAKAANSIEAYIDFLKRYPNNNFASEVEELLETKGTIIELTKKELVPIEGLSGGISDSCWLEYRGFLEAESEDEHSKSGFMLWYKKKGFHSEAYKIDSINGKVGQILGGAWAYQLLRKGQQLGGTVIDEFGKVTTWRNPIETVFITVKFGIISSSDSQARVLLLTESKIVTRTL